VLTFKTYDRGNETETNSIEGKHKKQRSKILNKKSLTMKPKNNNLKIKNNGKQNMIQPEIEITLHKKVKKAP
jgi:hypothetical protein